MQIILIVAKMQIFGICCDTKLSSIANAQYNALC